jgi:parvulin-like peptidyl-prolyl isomerase
MKRTVLLSAAVAAALVATVTAAERQLVEGIVVRVNDRILTVADMRKRVAERVAETGVAVPPGEYPQLVAEATDDLCMLERAVELKIEVSDEEVNEAIKGLREQNKDRFTTDKEFEAALQASGMTLDQLRAKMHDQMLINRALSREMGSLPITDEELRHRYEREKASYAVPEKIHLEDLVFATGGGTGETARARAEAQRLVAAVRSGTEFSAALKQEVDSGAATGGDLGTVAVPDLRPEIRDAVASLKPGEVSEPVETSSGIYVFRVDERIPAGVKPFAEVAEELRRKEIDERYRSKMKSIVDDLKKRYVVEVHPELFTPPHA